MKDGMKGKGSFGNVMTPLAPHGKDGTPSATHLKLTGRPSTIPSRTAAKSSMVMGPYGGKKPQS